jgi:hypothetical protein
MCLCTMQLSREALYPLLHVYYTTAAIRPQEIRLQPAPAPHLDEVLDLASLKVQHNGILLLDIGVGVAQGAAIMGGDVWDAALAKLHTAHLVKVQQWQCQQGQDHQEHTCPEHASHCWAYAHTTHNRSSCWLLDLAAQPSISFS